MEVEFVYEGSTDEVKPVYRGCVNQDGKRHGKGEMKWMQGTQNEASYHGDWMDGKAHGEGTMKSTPGGYLYKGGFSANVRNGFGVQTWDDFEVVEYQG